MTAGRSCTMDQRASTSSVQRPAATCHHLPFSSSSNNILQPSPKFLPSCPFDLFPSFLFPISNWIVSSLQFVSIHSSAIFNWSWSRCLWWKQNLFFHLFYSDYLDVLFTGQRQRQLVTDFFITKMFYTFTIFSFIHLLTYFYGWLHWFISLVQLVCNSCYHSQFTQQSSFFIFSVNCEFVS